MQPILRVELFDTFRLVSGGGVAIRLRSKKGASLLAYLVLRAGQQHDREQLASILWPDEDVETARGRLKTELSRLRKDLEEIREGASEILASGRQTVSVVSELVSSDACEFSDLLGRAAKVYEPIERACLLQTAVQLYQGPLWPACYEEWIEDDRRRLGRDYSDALRELTECLRTAGEIQRSIDYAALAVRADPLDEPATCILMELCLDLGQASSALRHFQELSSVLNRELGVSPGPQARELAQRCLAAASATRSRETKCDVAEEAIAGPLRPNEWSGATKREPTLIESPSWPHNAHLPPSRQHLKIRLLLPAMVIAAAAIITIVTLSGIGGRRTGKTIPAMRGHSPLLWECEVVPKPDEKPNSEPTAITTDGANNIYVTGFVQTLKRDTDYVTLKYDPAGNLVWRRTYNGVGNDVDRARLIAVDAGGNVYVTGDSDNGQGDSSKTKLDGLDIATIKYGTDGERSPTWPDVGFGVGVRRWNGREDGEDRPIAMRLDDVGNVYVLAKSWESHGKPGEGEFESALIKYGVSGSQEWVAPYSGSHLGDIPAGLAIDRFGEVYIAVTSRTLPSSGPETDIVVIKYDSSGKQVWQRPFGEKNQFDDEAKAIGTDKAGNVYVVGQARGGKGSPDWSRTGAVTVSYDREGRLRWERGTVDEDDRIEEHLAVDIHPDGTQFMAGLGRNKKFGNVLRSVLRGAEGMRIWPHDCEVVDFIPFAVARRSEVMYTASIVTHPKGDKELIAIKFRDQGDMDASRTFRRRVPFQSVALTVDSAKSPIVAFQSADTPDTPRTITIVKYSP